MKKIFFLLWAVQGFAAFNLTWGTPAVSLDSNPPVGDTDSNAAIAMDRMGNAVATWGRTAGKGAVEHIWASVYNHSARVWAATVQISGSSSACNSQVAIDSSGNAILIWEEGFPSRIVYRTLSPQGIWNPDLSLPPETVSKSKNAQMLPQIGIDSEGGAIAIWIESIKDIHEVHSAKKGLQTTWNYLGKISSALSNATLTQGKSLAANQRGQAIAVWQEWTANNSKICSAFYTNGTWSPSFSLSEQNQSGETPSAGIDAAGNSVIVWCQNNQIVAKTLREQLLSPQLQVSDPAYSSRHPHVAVDEKGDAVVVFERINSIHKFIASSTLPVAGRSWTKQIDLSGPSSIEAFAAGYPVLAMNSIGDAVVIWKEWTGANMVIQGAGYSLGTWSFVRTLSDPKGNSGAPMPAYDLAVALNHAGHILAIWPEDPKGQQTLQIKTTVAAQEKSIDPPPSEDSILQMKMTSGVGLANEGPLPPLADLRTIVNGIVLGEQKAIFLPAHTDLFNKLCWASPGGVAYYNIYRGSLRDRIASTKDLYFDDHRRIPEKEETYLITSVDFNEHESGPLTILVPPSPLTRKGKSR